MKVIKRIRRETPEQKLSTFYNEIGIVTKTIIALYTVPAIVLYFTSAERGYSFGRLFYMRITEVGCWVIKLVFFWVVAVSDLKREEEKGSFFLIITWLTKSNIEIRKI
jgi:hypothetical protein